MEGHKTNSAPWTLPRVSPLVPSSEERRLLVVGGGAGGFELAMSIKARLTKEPKEKIHTAVAQMKSPKWHLGNVCACVSLFVVFVVCLFVWKQVWSSCFILSRTRTERKT